MVLTCYAPVDFSAIDEMDFTDGLARQLFEAAPDFGIVIDADGRILHANGRAQDLLGYGPDELVGQHLEMLLPDRFRDAHAGHRKAFFASPAPRPMGSGLDLYARRKDGSEVPVEISLSPVTTPERVMVLAAVRDVSVQQALHRELRDASRAKSRFLAAASHDLRQPIQALTLLNSVARRSTVDPLHQSIIEKQQRSLDSMARLLNALLDISKLEAGIVKPDIADHDVQKIFDDLRAGFEEQAQAKGLQFIVEPCGDVAHTDARLLTQILENFVSNAIRYTREGFVRLRCLHQQRLIRLEVADSGLGIPADRIADIFEEFHQLDAGSSRPDGLGLGLSIVRRNAELLGYGVDVESTPGRGSAFSIVVPQGRSKQTGVADSEPNPLADRLGGLILVVDDEPSVLDATAILLRVEGFDVLTATSEQEALELVSRRSPDLVIADYRLRHGANGADVVRAARARVAGSVPAILVSGDTSEASALAELDDAVFLTKPVNVDALLSAIRRRLHHSS